MCEIEWYHTVFKHPTVYGALNSFKEQKKPRKQNLRKFEQEHKGKHHEQHAYFGQKRFFLFPKKKEKAKRENMACSFLVLVSRTGNNSARYLCVLPKETVGCRCQEWCWLWNRHLATGKFDLHIFILYSIKLVCHEKLVHLGIFFLKPAAEGVVNLTFSLMTAVINFSHFFFSLSENLGNANICYSFPFSSLTNYVASSSENPEMFFFFIHFYFYPLNLYILNSTLKI